MNPKSFTVTEKMKNEAIGTKNPLIRFEVEEGHIRRFAQAIEDPNPEWNNERDNTGNWEGPFAPPTFLRTIGVLRPELPFTVPYMRLLDGGSEWEYFDIPIKSGDSIATTAQVSDLFQRETKLGQMLFVIMKINYCNDDNRVIVVQTSTLIMY